MKNNLNVLNGFCINHERNMAKGLEKAERAARQIGIDLIYKDLSDTFDGIVAGNFCSEYMKGRTPNPCVVCNPNIKFRALLDAADEAGAAYIATGHYADTFFNPEDGLWYIKNAANERKDQSYMLYRLGQEAISRLILPLKDYEDKELTRSIAREAGIGNSEQKDSQEICFIDADDNYIDYMARKGYIAPEGNFVDIQGNILGKHKGISHYTIGQRKGLGIALGYPAFVSGIDSENNTVELSNGDNLFTGKVTCSDGAGPIFDKYTENKLCQLNMEVLAKIRYAAKPARALLKVTGDNTAALEFFENQRAVTPGQSVVFYKDSLLLGGGFID